MGRLFVLLEIVSRERGDQMTTTAMIFGALVILCCIGCSKLSGKFGVPALLLFIVLDRKSVV